MDISKVTSKVIGDKRRWRQYKARVRDLPPNYRAAVDAFERYLMYFGLVEVDSASSLFEDLADLFERAAADGMPIRDVVGEDPVEFIEALKRNYPDGGYVAREQARLVGAIESLERQEGGR